jgi:hypothetical protein
MTIIFIGYVCTVVLAAYFINNAYKQVANLEARNRNLNVWLEEANEDQFAKGDALRVAYRTIDRLQDKIQKLTLEFESNDREQTIEEFAAEIGAELDSVHEVGLSEDEIIAYYTEGDNACEAEALATGYTYNSHGDLIANAGTYYDDEGNPILDNLSWTPQDGVTYSESDESDV